MLTEKGNKIDNGTFRYSPPWAKKAFFETGAAVFKVTWWMFWTQVNFWTQVWYFGPRWDIIHGTIFGFSPLAPSPRFTSADSQIQCVSKCEAEKSDNFLWFPKQSSSPSSQSKSMSAAGVVEVSVSSSSSLSFSVVSPSSSFSSSTLFSSGSRPSVLSGGTYFPWIGRL